MTTDGFLGYMLTRTPLGKRSPTDDANYWTIVIDAKNFAGPVMYMSSWFWDMRINWHPQSISWSDPRSLISYIAEGFEGGAPSRPTSAYESQESRAVIEETQRKRAPILCGRAFRAFHNFSPLPPFPLIPPFPALPPFLLLLLRVTAFAIFRLASSKQPWVFP